MAHYYAERRHRQQPRQDTYLVSRHSHRQAPATTLGNDSTEWTKRAALTNQLISACQGVKACSAVLIRPASTFEAVASELRNAVGNWTRYYPRSQFNYEESDPSEDAFYINRRYNRNDAGQRDRPRNYSAQGQGEGPRSYNPGGSRFRRSSTRPQYNDNTQRRNNKKCYVCNKPGCWSTRHSREDRKEAQQRYQTYV
ncbi:hypothetical protein PTTW11_03056 [Pyrenophora teres f. teres]|uniref:Uncharacterized protein n=1 Tax=Pyrenophora teres f. teres TaxID=97479 RepID=A0A6S6VWL2_9PLEO|nr:hypothetical protein PTTW11_03056 [Pyrenophora teres f. teres]